MKTEGAHCSTVHDTANDATAQPSRRAVMVLIAAIGIAGGWTTGFFCGAILTKPNRQKVAAEIAALKAQNALLADDLDVLLEHDPDYDFSQTSPELRTNLRTVMECSDDFARLLTFDAIRVAIGTGKNPTKFQFALECSGKVLDDLLATIAGRPPIEDEGLRKCRDLIVKAANIEKQVHLGFIELMQGKTQGMPAVKELSEQNSEAYWAAALALYAQSKRFGIYE